MHDATQFPRHFQDLVALASLPETWLGADPHGIAASLASTLYSALSPKLVYICLHHRDDGTAVCIAQRELGAVDASLAEQLRQPVADWVRSHGPDARLLWSNPSGEGPVSIFASPLGSDGNLGVIAAGFDLEGRPTEFDRTLLKVATTQAAQAAHHARLMHALQDETKLLEIINKAGAALSSDLDLHTVLQRVTDTATQASGAQFGAFFYNVHDETSGDAYMLYTLSGAPRAAFEHLGKPRATPVFGPTFLGGPPIRVDDILKDPRYGQWAPHHGMPPGHLPVRSYLAVSVASRTGEVIGGLFFGHSEPGVFTERDERIVVGLAAQAAIAVDNARLYEEAKRQAESRRQLLDSERAARAELERVATIKDEFLATLSHELRTPLNAILGWSQVLHRQFAGDVGALKGIETIERNTRIQTQLINDLLDMSRITSGKLTLNIAPLNPHHVIEAAIETVMPSIQAKGLRLHQILEPTAGPIYADASRVQQIIWNLLSNAIKFTPKGGKIQVVLRRVNSHIEIAVADSGIGISSEFLPMIFDRFRQQNSTITRSHGGLGLGLAIVKHLVESHGGTIEASSAGINLGTTMRISLPLVAVHSVKPEPSTIKPEEGPCALLDKYGTDLQGLKILVVDDEADTRELMQRLLEDCGGECITAESAAEAFALLTHRSFDVCVSDIGMPDMDGYELIQRVRRELPSLAHMPAIALTAYARSEDRTRALRAGFAAHLAKPVEPTELLTTVASVTGRLGPNVSA